MKEFPIKEKTFIKSPNKASKILLRYTIALSVYYFFILALNIIKKNSQNTVKLLITLIISSVVSIVFQYIINIVRNKKEIKLIFKEENILAIPLIITILFYKEKLYIVLLSLIISLIPKLFSRNINISSCVYGILFVLLYKELYLHIPTQIALEKTNILKQIIGTNLLYTSPVLGILSFIYLFNRKSVKYPTVFSYTITFIILITIYSLFTKNLWFLLNALVTDNIIFYIIFLLPDYKITPITYEGQVLYGIVLATTSTILKFILPSFAIIIPLILGPIILTKYIDKISYKLKYNKKFYKAMLTICLILALISVTSICLIF